MSIKKIIYLTGLSVDQLGMAHSVHTCEIADAWARNGIDVTLYAPLKKNERMVREDVLFKPKVSRLPIKLSRAWLGIRFVMATIFQRPDLLYFRGLASLAPFAILAKIVSCRPLAIEVNGIPRIESLPPCLTRKVSTAAREYTNKWVYRFATLVVANTHATREDLIRTYQIKESKIIVVPNGTNVSLYAPKLRVDNRFSASDTPTVGFAGVLKPWFDLSFVMKAMAEVRTTLPTAEFLIAGDGSEIDKLQEDALSLGLLEKGVRFLGVVPYRESMDFLASCDVCISPLQDSERNRAVGGGSLLKTFMYLASGRPALVPALDYLEWLNASQGIIWYDPSSVSDLRDKIIQALEMPKSQRREMGMLGRKYVQNNYTWEHSAQQILDACEKITGQTYQ